MKRFIDSIISDRKANLEKIAVKLFFDTFSSHVQSNVRAQLRLLHPSSVSIKFEMSNDLIQAFFKHPAIKFKFLDAVPLDSQTTLKRCRFRASPKEFA